MSRRQGDRCTPDGYEEKQHLIVSCNRVISHNRRIRERVCHQFRQDHNHNRHQQGSVPSTITTREVTVWDRRSGVAIDGTSEAATECATGGRTSRRL